MNFDDIKDRLRELFQTINGRLRESPAFIQLMEKYADLNPRLQKAVLMGAGATFALFMLIIPSCVFMSAGTSLDDFESKKQLMRDLYRINREASSLPPPPMSMSAGDLRNRIQNEMNMAGLQPEQLGPVSDFDNKSTASSWIPKTLEQNGVSVAVKKLNLSQIVDIGQKLQRINSTAKMVGIQVVAQAADPHYFDVVYKLVAFNLPPEKSAKDSKDTKKKFGSN